MPMYQMLLSAQDKRKILLRYVSHTIGHKFGKSMITQNFAFPLAPSSSLPTMLSMEVQLFLTAQGGCTSQILIFLAQAQFERDQSHYGEEEEEGFIKKLYNVGGMSIHVPTNFFFNAFSTNPSLSSAVSPILTSLANLTRIPYSHFVQSYKGFLPYQVPPIILGSSHSSIINHLVTCSIFNIVCFFLFSCTLWFLMCFVIF